MDDAHNEEFERAISVDIRGIEMRKLSSNDDNGKYIK